MFKLGQLGFLLALFVFYYSIMNLKASQRVCGGVLSREEREKCYNQIILKTKKERENLKV